MKVTGIPGSAALLLLTLLPVFSSAGQTSRQGAPVNPPQLKVDVDLVLANVTVTDSRGRFVQDLPMDRFRIWEDKVEQKIVSFSNEETPLTFGIILDKSGSMGNSRPSGNAGSPYPTSSLDEARSTAYSCLQNGLREDEYFLVEFSDRPMIVADFTNDLSRLREKLLFMGAGGRTALWDAIYAGVNKAGQGSHSRKALLVLTDGLENRSRYTLSELKGILREQDVRIYGVDREQVQFSSLGTLAAVTGGRIFRSSDPCRELAADLRNQYVLGYTPSNKAVDGAWRDIRVKLNTSGLPRELSNLSVRVRAGYYAKSQ